MILVALIALGCFVFALSQPDVATQLSVLNLAGEPVDIFWADDDSGEYVRQFEKPLRNGTRYSISAFESHRFVIRYFNDRDDIQTEFVKGAGDERIEIRADDQTHALSVMTSTTEKLIENDVQRAIDVCSNLSGEQLATCISEELYDQVNRLNREKEKVKKYRNAISSRLRNYTCADPSMTTTPHIDQYNFTHDEHTYDVRIMLDLSHAKIWAVDNFVTPEECKILVEHGRPRLHRATVAAEDGSSVVSENRKAQQASYNLQQDTYLTDPLWPLQRRILALTNHHTGYNLTIDGQEGFTIIQYNPDDQYTPHCDGNCDNQPHVQGGRIATAVLYCQAPIEGGATTFTKADTFVKPKVGAATFFSYMGPDGRMEDGFTEHSGCPVIRGEKWITTFWMRGGVTWENHHGLYDPSGLRLMD